MHKGFLSKSRMIFILAIIVAALSGLTGNAVAQERPDPTDTVREFMQTISGKAGERKSLLEFSNIVDPGAHVINAVEREEKMKPSWVSMFYWGSQVLNNEYAYLEECLEQEIQVYNNIAQVMCPYRFWFGDKVLEADLEHATYGVVSMQLYYTGEKWMVLSYLFTHEGGGQTIAERFDLDLSQ